jgi:phenylacetate-CoA ligase
LSAKERWLECVRRWRLHPDAPDGDGCWAPELERASRGRLEEIQSEKIAAAAAYLYEDSPFYRARFDEAGVRPPDVRSVEDLWKVPITRKQEWADDVQRHPPWGTFSPLRPGGCTIGAASGERRRSALSPLVSPAGRRSWRR